MQALPTLPMHHATTVNIAHASPQHCSCITTTLLMHHHNIAHATYNHNIAHVFAVQQVCIHSPGVEHSVHVSPCEGV